MEKNYFAAIEFGSIYLNAIIMSFHQDKLDVVARYQCNCDGFKNGEILDFDAFVSSIDNLKRNILKKYKINLDEAILILSSKNHYKRYTTKVTTKILTEMQKIGKEQINKIKNLVKNAETKEDEVLIEDVAIEYFLDGDRKFISEPYGQSSSFLTMLSSIYTLPKQYQHNIVHAFEECSIKVLACFLDCTCGVYAYEEKDLKLEKQLIHIHVNQDDTTISSFSRNSLLESYCVDFSLNSLVKYLATTLDISKPYALELLQSYFVGDISLASDVVFDEEKNLSEKRITSIVYNRIYDGFNEILEACIALIKECNFTMDISYYVTGYLNDFDGVLDELRKYSNNHSIKDANMNVTTLNTQAYCNCYGAVKTFIQRNMEFVLNRIETDVQEYTLKKDVNNNENEQKKSRFVDIFDE